MIICRNNKWEEKSFDKKKKGWRNARNAGSEGNLLGIRAFYIPDRIAYRQFDFISS